MPAADELPDGLPVYVVSVLDGVWVDEGLPEAVGDAVRLPVGNPDSEPLMVPVNEYDPVPVGENVGDVNVLLAEFVGVEDGTLSVVDVPEPPIKKDFTFAA